MAALSRRGALRGSLAASLGLVAGVAPVLAAPTPSANDARLDAIANRMTALQAEVDAFKGDDDAFSVLNDGFGPLVEEMDRTPADTLAGVLHKIRATDVPGVGDEGQAHDIMVGICEDVVRLHAAGALHV